MILTIIAMSRKGCRCTERFSKEEDAVPKVEEASMVMGCDPTPL